jgi:hypothetical protein
MVLHFRGGAAVELSSAVVEAPYAAQVRLGEVQRIDVFLDETGV